MTSSTISMHFIFFSWVGAYSGVLYIPRLCNPYESGVNRLFNDTTFKYDGIFTREILNLNCITFVEYMIIHT